MREAIKEELEYRVLLDQLARKETLVTLVPEGRLEIPDRRATQAREGSKVTLDERDRMVIRESLATLGSKETEGRGAEWD